MIRRRRSRREVQKSIEELERQLGLEDGLVDLSTDPPPPPPHPVRQFGDGSLETQRTRWEREGDGFLLAGSVRPNYASASAASSTSDRLAQERALSNKLTRERALFYGFHGSGAELSYEPGSAWQVQPR